jgi:hypothetical protein
MMSDWRALTDELRRMADGHLHWRGFVGAATAPETRFSTGAAIGWELLPHLTIDGSGVWTVPHRKASTFTALLGVRVNLSRRAVSYRSRQVASGFTERRSIP